MEQNNKIITSRWERLRKYYDLGIKFVLAAGILSFSKDRLINAFTMESFSQFLIALPSIILLLETISLIFFWIKAVGDELQMLKDNLSSFIPTLPSSTFRIIIGLSLLLGSLAYFSNKIVIFSSIFVTFKLCEIWGTWVRDSRLKLAIGKAKEKIPEENKQILANIGTIESYYLKNPQLQLAITVLFFSFVALILGLLGELLTIRNSNWLTVGAYFVMILIIAINEIVYAIWRHKRDAILKEVYH